MRRSAVVVVVLALAATAPAAAPSAAAPGPARDAVSVDRWGTVTRSVLPGRRAAPPAAAADPDLEPGFPVTTLERGGTYHAGPAVNVVVGDLDPDASLELCASALAAGPLYCWQHTGALMPGWGPDQPVAGAAYPAVARVHPLPGPTVVAGHFGDRIAAHDRRGRLLPGWPVLASNYVSTPPTVARVNPRRSLVVLGEEDWFVHAYRADGTPPRGWPADHGLGGQERHTPAAADVDGVPGAELFTASGWSSPGVYLFGVRADGTLLDGYPVLFQGTVDTFPAVGDVDGDGALEVVVVGTGAGSPPGAAVIVVDAATGRVEGTRPLSGSASYGSAPALADLDGTCDPSDGLDIVVQTEPTLEVVRWDGSSFSNRPGWPRTWGGGQWLGSSAPVVGDVDGDGRADIVITGQVAGQGVDGYVYVFDGAGNLHPRFPKHLPIGSGGVPAIADVDLDGRNEVAVKGSAWDGVPGERPSLWLFDLGGGAHGPVEWGQFMHDAAHTGTYRRPPCG